MKKTIICFILVLAMLLALFAGCGSEKGVNVAEQSTQASESTLSEETASPEGATDTQLAGEELTEEAEVPTPEDAPPEPSEDAPPEPSEEPVKTIEYPIADGSVTISAFAAVPMFVLNVLENADITNAPAIQALTEATGVNMEFHGYQAMNAAEEYGIMLASQDYPDLLANAIDYYAGGAEKLVEDEIILDLNDYLEDFAPDYLAALNDVPDIKKSVTTDSGYIGVFAGWANPAAMYTGLIIRQDWLDALGMSTPKTYEQLEDVLVAFKNNYGCKDSLYMVSYCGGTFSDNGLIKGYGVAGMIGDRANQHPFYQVDGEVRCGLLTDEYKNYVTMLADWYSQGLISSDFISYTSPSMDDNAVVSGSTGVFFSSNDKFETYYSLAPDDSFKVSALRDVTVNENDPIHLAQDLFAPTTVQNSWSISTQCKDPEIAASYLNYLYTDAGVILTNYGMEGVSFEYVDGNAVMSDMILHDPNNSSFIMQFLYTTGNFLPGLVDQHKADSAMEETALASYDIWSENVDPEYTIINSLLPEDSDAYQVLWSDISAYAQQKVLEYITGAASMDSFDTDFVNTLKDMGIDTLTGYRQKAVDAYNTK